MPETGQGIFGGILSPMLRTFFPLPGFEEKLNFPKPFADIS
jgi:hypothetical protein